jgi:hypothetical protein
MGPDSRGWLRGGLNAATAEAWGDLAGGKVRLGPQPWGSVSPETLFKVKDTLRILMDL